MTLRTRLFIALLALSLLPTVLFTLFTVDQLDRAIRRGYRPAVERSLESGLEVTKVSLARWEASVLLQAGRLAKRWPVGALDARAQEAVRHALDENGLDFVQIYERRGAAWARALQTVPEGVIVPVGVDLGPELDGALAAKQVVRSDRGAMAGLARRADGTVLAVGLWLPAGLFTQVEDVGRGATYYRQLGVHVHLQRGLYVLLLAGLVIGLVFTAAALSAALARGMTRPIGDLAGAVERVALGDLTSRVSPRGARELRSLGASFNAMTEALARARSSLQQAEREAAWRDVARMLAHEFKNILTPLKLSLQLLECQVAEAPPEQRAAAARSLEAALREVDHLGRLASQFSQYARLPEPQFERVDLAEIARAAADLELPNRVRADLSGVRSVHVRADRLLLSRALHNLLLNAGEASPPGGTVEVRSHAEDDADAAIEVLDRGAGVPAELEERAFEPYVSTKRRGSGLGLSLVRDIVLQHGGAVSLAGREGGGTRARIVLPRARAAEG